jgi:hypothetical protein
MAQLCPKNGGKRWIEISARLDDTRKEEKNGVRWIIGIQREREGKQWTDKK